MNKLKLILATMLLAAFSAKAAISLGDVVKWRLVREGSPASNVRFAQSFYLSYESGTNYVQWTYNTASNRVEIIEVTDGTTNTYYDLTN
jgi:hypothetical protein